MLELFYNFSFYLLIGSFGAFMKDLHETLTDKNERIRLSEVLIGASSAAFICLFLKDKWLADASINTMAAICFVLGILGFEIFGNFTSIAKVKRFVKDVAEMRSKPPDEWTDSSPPVRQVQESEEVQDVIYPEGYEVVQEPSEEVEQVYETPKKKSNTSRRKVKSKDKEE